LIRYSGKAVFLPWFRDPSGVAGFGAVIIEGASALSAFGSIECDVTDQLAASAEVR